MKKIIVAFITIFIFGCSNDSSNGTEIINNTTNDYLKVTLDAYNFNFNEGSSFNSTNNNVVLELLNSNIVKRIGSPIASSTSSGIGSYGYTNNIYDTIFKENNKITLFKKVIPFNGITAIAPDKKEFFLHNNGKINYKINYKEEYTNSDNDTLYFNYSNEKIIQTYSKAYGYKTKESDFYYNTNENLDSIVTKFYYYDSQLNQILLSPSREVETFEGYDTSINPFNSLTIFDDMFKRSLSKNNYSKHNITQYNPYFVKYTKNLTLQHDSMGNLIYKN
jgi:hypothetical protein